jgi:hypothetical protein
VRSHTPKRQQTALNPVKALLRRGRDQQITNAHDRSDFIAALDEPGLLSRVRSNPNGPAPDQEET